MEAVATVADRDNYWNADHPQFAFSSLRNIDSLFYHQMPLSVQGTYVTDGIVSHSESKC